MQDGHTAVWLAVERGHYGTARLLAFELKATIEPTLLAQIRVISLS